MWSRIPLDRGNFTQVKIRSQPLSRKESILIAAHRRSDLRLKPAGKVLLARTKRIAAGIAIL
jgi:hypothetical protein